MYSCPLRFVRLGLKGSDSRISRKACDVSLIAVNFKRIPAMHSFVVHLPPRRLPFRLTLSWLWPLRKCLPQATLHIGYLQIPKEPLFLTFTLDETVAASEVRPSIEFKVKQPLVRVPFSVDDLHESQVPWFARQTPSHHSATTEASQQPPVVELHYCELQWSS